MAGPGAQRVKQIKSARKRSPINMSASRKEKLKGLKRSLDYSDTALKQMNTELIAMPGPFL